MKFVLKIRHGPQPAHDNPRPALLGVYSHEAAETGDLHVVDTVQGIPGQGNTLSGGKRGGFTRAPGDCDDNPIKHSRRPLNDIRMAIGDRIKRARIDSRCIHSDVSNVVLIQSVFNLPGLCLF